MPRMQKCPAIQALDEALNVFSGLRRDILVDKKEATRHTSGLAIDIFFNSYSPQEKQRALELIDVLVAHHKAMKWSDLIFTDFHIGGGVGGYMGDGRTRYAWTGGKHDDHIHLDWVDLSLRTGPPGSAAFLYNPYEWSDLAKKTEWKSSLQSDLSALASKWGSGGSPAKAQAIPAWLPGWWRVVQDGDDYYYHFAPGGGVVWTYSRPSTQAALVSDPRNRGACSTNGGGLTVTWNEAGGMSTVEVFNMQSTTRMQGTSNRGGPLTATRV